MNNEVLIYCAFLLAEILIRFLRKELETIRSEAGYEREMKWRIYFTLFAKILHFAFRYSCIVRALKHFHSALVDAFEIYVIELTSVFLQNFDVSLRYRRTGADVSERDLKLRVFFQSFQAAFSSFSVE